MSQCTNSCHHYSFRLTTSQIYHPMTIRRQNQRSPLLLPTILLLLLMIFSPGFVDSASSRISRSLLSTSEMAVDELVDADGSPKQCVIQVQVVKEVKGKCIRLRGGAVACQGADYLDPFAQACSDT